VAGGIVAWIGLGRHDPLVLESVDEGGDVRGHALHDRYAFESLASVVMMAAAASSSEAISSSMWASAAPMSIAL
jgi:hypothetical protein